MCALYNLLSFTPAEKVSTPMNPHDVV